MRNLGVVDSAVTCASQSGGIVGYSNAGLVTNCYADVTVHTGGNYAGGIVGSANSTITVENCYNLGTITADGSYAGGIAPCPTIGDVLDCYGLQSAVSGASANNGNFSNSKGYLAGFTMSAQVTGDNFSGADGTLSGGGTLVDKLNAWVEGQESSDYYTWQIADGVNGGYPVQNAPLSTTTYAVTVTANKTALLDRFRQDLHAEKHHLFQSCYQSERCAARHIPRAGRRWGHRRDCNGHQRERFRNAELLHNFRNGFGLCRRRSLRFRLDCEALYPSGYLLPNAPFHGDNR